MGTAAPEPTTIRRLGAALAMAVGARRVESVRAREGAQQAADRQLRLQRLVRDLQRLDAEVGRLLVADSRTPSLAYRLKAASWAYDSVLRDACVFAGVAGANRTDTVPFDPLDRLRAEAGLVAAGVRW